MGIREWVVSVFQRETQNISGVLIGLMVGAGGGFFVGLLVAASLMDWEWTKDANLWDVMTAFGTVGATFAAGISVFRIRGVEKRAAKLVASELHIGLLATRNDLDGVIKNLAYANVHQVNMRQALDGLNAMNEFPESEKLMALNLGCGGAAICIAEAKGCVTSARRFARKIEESISGSRKPHSSDIENMEKYCKEAHAKIKWATTECRRFINKTGR